MKKEKDDKKFTVRMRVKRRRPRVRRRKRLAVLPRVLVLVQGQVKAPYAAIELHIGSGKVAVYTLAAMHRVVK